MYKHTSAMEGLRKLILPLIKVALSCWLAEAALTMAAQPQQSDKPRRVLLNCDAGTKPRATIVLAVSADPLERFAAQELQVYLKKLFDVEAPIAPKPGGQGFIFRVGVVKEGLGDQAILLRTEGQTLTVGGGSPRATLWAVYELVQRWGVRYLLHGDVLPTKSAELRFPEREIRLEPVMSIRQWRVMNDFACGPESWGMADYRPVIDQLAKLKFNRILVYMWPWHPFVHYEAGGIKRRSATLFFGFDFPITEDMPGRHLFGQARSFWNPDLPQKASYDDLSTAGERLVHNLMDYARRRGMQSVINANLGEFPCEFGPLLKDAQKVHQVGALTVVPGTGTGMSDPALNELAVAVLRATINTYPESDFVALGVQEHRQWLGQYESAWKALDAKYGIEKVRPLTEVLAAAGRRSDYPGGAERAVREVKGDIVTLCFYDRLLNDLKVLQDSRRPDVRLIYDCFAEELCPVLPRILPPGSETLNFVDYTPSRILRRKEVLESIGGRELPSTLIYTLHDDNVGVLPQLATGSLHELTRELRRNGWAGFSTRYWLIGDHDPCVAYLARAAWHADTVPDSVYRDQIGAVCGEACVDDMLTVFRELEATTIALEEHGLGLTFPVPGMIMKHWRPAATPGELAEDRRGYQRAAEAARRAQDKATSTGRSYVAYWVGRLEFGIGYLDTIDHVRRAAQAESEKRAADALQHAEAALASARTALEAYARVARDQSDRGAIATMAEYVYRPLKEKVAMLEGARRE